MNNHINDAKSGTYYFTQGWELMMQPGLKRYVFIPILINIIILGGAFYGIYQQIGSIVDYVLGYIPAWLHFLSFILTSFIVLSALLFFGYFFSTFANLIAAPFNSMLSAKLESMLTSKNLPDDSWLGLAKDIGRSIRREFQNLAYYLPRLIGILLLFVVPVIGTFAAPFILFLFNSWMMSIQYNDYAFDNHKVSFPTMRDRLKKDRSTNLIFGAWVNLCTMIPIVNLFIMPAAVCGGTLQWVKKYRADFMK